MAKVLTGTTMNIGITTDVSIDISHMFLDFTSLASNLFWEDFFEIKSS